MENSEINEQKHCAKLDNLMVEVEILKKNKKNQFSCIFYFIGFIIFSIPTIAIWYFMLKQPIATAGILKCENVAELFNAQFANMLTVITFFGGIIPLLAYWFQHRSFDKQQKQIDEILVSLRDKVEKAEVQNVFATFSQNIKTGLDDIKTVQNTLQGTINNGLESIKETTSQQFNGLAEVSKQANANFQNMFQDQNKQFSKSLGSVLFQVADAFTAEEQKFICLLSASFLFLLADDKITAKRYLEILLKRLEADFKWTSNDGYANMVTNISQYAIFIQASSNHEDILLILEQIREKISNKSVK